MHALTAKHVMLHVISQPSYLFDLVNVGNRFDAVTWSVIGIVIYLRSNGSYFRDKIEFRI